LFLGTGDSTYNFGSGEFTLETWLYLPSLPSAYTRIYTCFNGVDIYPNSGEAVTIEITNSNIINCIVNNSSGAGTSVSSPTLVANTWYHIAFVRYGNTTQFFLNGISQGTASTSGAHYWTSNHRTIIGAWYLNGSYSRFLNGYIDDLRITKGLARYTQNFTPPTAPLPTSGGY
jgi:hypothetical protein